MNKLYVLFYSTESRVAYNEQGQMLTGTYYDNFAIKEDSPDSDSVKFHLELFVDMRDWLIEEREENKEKFIADINKSGIWKLKNDIIEDKIDLTKSCRYKVTFDDIERDWKVNTKNINPQSVESLLTRNKIIQRQILEKFIIN